MVLNHIAISVSSLSEAKKFYLAVLGPLGYKEKFSIEGVVTGFECNGVPDFWIGATKPDSAPSKGMHIAFTGDSREVVHQFYEIALKSGAKDNGAPGLREHYAPGYYAAFVLDAEGNNIEVVTFAGEK